MERWYMIDYRNKNRLTVKQMAQRCEISMGLLSLLEGDDQSVTHPEIAKTIAKEYHLKKSQYIHMLPENYRPGPNYDPNRYKVNVNEKFVFPVHYGGTGIRRWMYRV